MIDIKTHSVEKQLLIKSTLFITAILAINLFISGFTMHSFFARKIPGMILLSGGVVFTCNLAFYKVFQNWLWFRVLTITYGLFLPISLHIALGGYTNSGGILMWGILIILWSVVIEETRLKYFLVSSFIFLAIVFYFYEQQLSPTVPPLLIQQKVFLIINLLVSMTLCIFIVFDLNQSKLKKEKLKSDELLLNILPAATAQELKETGQTQPMSYESVTVMFTDFKGFTQIAEELSPEEVVRELHHCFKEFDLVAKQHGLEKIKTIGDAYMCVGGLPLTNDTHPTDVVRAALAMRNFINTWKEEHLANNKPVWDVRIGIHTGKVVAGVVGVSKFSYDIWGDTVNMASRMESSGSPGQVNISEDTFLLVQNHFNCTARGKIAAKNKGEMEMYFVQDEKHI
ncbi:MAG: adenylate/guanylate cyclase domain-containing protein [Spirochaetota bacterium]